MVSRLPPGDVVNASRRRLPQSRRHRGSCSGCGGHLFCHRSLSGSMDRGKVLAVGNRNAVTTATLVFPHAFCWNLHDQPGSWHPTARHSGSCDVVRCHLGTTFGHAGGMGCQRHRLETPSRHHGTVTAMRELKSPTRQEWRRGASVVLPSARASYFRRQFGASCT